MGPRKGTGSSDSPAANLLLQVAMLASGGRGTWTGGSWGHCSLEKCFWPRTEPGPQSHWVPAAGSPRRLGGSWGQGLSFPGRVLSRLSLGWGTWPWLLPPPLAVALWFRLAGLWPACPSSCPGSPGRRGCSKSLVGTMPGWSALVMSRGTHLSSPRSCSSSSSSNSHSSCSSSSSDSEEGEEETAAQRDQQGPARLR